MEGCQQPQQSSPTLPAQPQQKQESVGVILMVNSIATFLDCMGQTTAGWIMLVELPVTPEGINLGNISYAVSTIHNYGMGRVNRNTYQLRITPRWRIMVSVFLQNYPVILYAGKVLIVEVHVFIMTNLVTLYRPHWLGKLEHPSATCQSSSTISRV